MFSFLDLIGALNGRFGAWNSNMSGANKAGIQRFPLEIKMSHTSLRVEVLAPYCSRMVVVVDDRAPGSGGERNDVVCVESFNLGDMPYFLTREWCKRPEGVEAVVDAVMKLINQDVEDSADRV